MNTISRTDTASDTDWRHGDYYDVEGSVCVIAANGEGRFVLVSLDDGCHYGRSFKKGDALRRGATRIWPGTVITITVNR